MATRFNARIGTDVVEQRVPGPNSERSGIGEGLEAMGSALGRGAAVQQQAQDQIDASRFRMEAEELRRRRSAIVADRAGGYAEMEAALASSIDELQRRSGPGASGFREQSDALITKTLNDFLATLPDDADVRERFEPMVAGLGARTRLNAERWETAKRTEYEGQRVGQWRDASAHAILTDPTPQVLQAKLDEAGAIVGALDVDGNARAELERQVKRGFVGTFVDARLEAGDWQSVAAIMDSPALDGFLTPDEKMRYRGRARSGEAVAARQAEQAASAARDEARDQARTIAAKIDAGIAPTEAELRGVRQRMQAAGVDEAELVRFDAQAVSIDVNRRYAETDAATTRTHRDQLRAKALAGTASEGEQMMLKQLDRLVDVKDEAEWKPLAELVKRGDPAATRQALGMLTGTPEARADKAEKLERGLGFVANLPASAQLYATEGRAVRRARPKDFGEEAEVKAMVDDMLGPVGLSMGGQYRELMRTAWDIMAGGQARIGATGFSADRMREAVLMATGARRRPDGVVQGGVQRVNGNPVLLPPWMTPTEFAGALARDDFGDAVYRGGKPGVKRDILANYRPEVVGEDAAGRMIYRMVNTAGEPLQAKGGGDYLRRFWQSR
jgi:hypothetical protein